MADFDLTQTDQQVQNILNDAQGAMGASAQTTLTTEYVMLKDTSGVYHKILKSSFTEAIRDVLAGLLVNNDKGTTINQIAAIASGDFGSITPANLASVLGVKYTVTLQPGETFNTNFFLGVFYIREKNSTSDGGFFIYNQIGNTPSWEQCSSNFGHSNTAIYQVYRPSTYATLYLKNNHQETKTFIMWGGPKDTL